MNKKLWYVSIKHEDDYSETIYHVKAEEREKAVAIATADYVENNGFYQGDRELFDQDVENGDITTYAFEVKETDILEEK